MKLIDENGNEPASRNNAPRAALKIRAICEKLPDGRVISPSALAAEARTTYSYILSRQVGEHVEDVKIKIGTRTWFCSPKTAREYNAKKK